MSITWLSAERPPHDVSRFVVHLGPIWPPTHGATIHVQAPLREVLRDPRAVVLYVDRAEPSPDAIDHVATANCSVGWIRSPDYNRAGRYRIAGRSLVSFTPYHVQIMRAALAGQSVGADQTLLLGGAASGAVDQAKRHDSILVVHDFDPEYARNLIGTSRGGGRIAAWWNYRATRRHFRQLYSDVAQVVTVGEEDARRVRELAPSAVVRSIPVEVPVDNVTEPRVPQRLVFIGSGSRNMESVLWTIRHVLPALHQLGVTIPFEIAGRLTADEIKRTQDAAQHVGLPSGAIRLHGWVRDSSEILSPDSILIAPFPRSAGVKVKCIEAMLRHCIVATNREGARATPLVEGSTGIVQDAGHEIATRVAEVLADETAALPLATAAYLAASEIHGEGAQAHAWKDALQS